MNQYSRKELWKALDQLAPLQFAGAWDNVGVLLDALPAQKVQQISDEKILLTIDLTESVFEEALAHHCTVIVCYHPIIFGGLKRLTLAHSQTRTLLRAAQAGIAIYSPHSALDAVRGGVCDWLAGASLLANVSSLNTKNFAESLHHLCTEYAPIEVDQADPSQGAGRLLTLKSALSLDFICKTLSTSLNMNLSGLQKKPYLRLATPEHYSSKVDDIKTIALCPGAGGGLFKSIAHVDLLITGEMSHHDVLARIQSGTTVILTEHSRCERGYLKHYQALMTQFLSIPVVLAESDDDPIYLYRG